MTASMEISRYILLEDRGVLAVAGPEMRSFLQAIVSNDVDKVTADHAVYAALLTAQGKFLHDFFMAAEGDGLLIDCEGPRLADLERRLTFYRLRAQVTFTDRSGELAVAAVIGESARDALGIGPGDGASAPFGGGVAFADPRLAALGVRALLPRDGARAALEAAGLEAASAADYDRLRLAHGLPDGSRDIVVEKGFLMESGIDDLGGVDFEKGCYIGQELTARTKHRGKAKRHLFRVNVDGPLPAPGTPITLGSRDAGEMRSGVDDLGLALLRIELVDQAAANGEPLTAGDARLTPVRLAWATY